MEIQKEISLEINKKIIGKTIPCIIEEMHNDGQIIARSYKDAPEVDGLVYIKTDENYEGMDRGFSSILTEKVKTGEIGTAKSLKPVRIFHPERGFWPIRVKSA